MILSSEVSLVAVPTTPHRNVMTAAIVLCWVVRARSGSAYTAVKIMPIVSETEGLASKGSVSMYAVRKMMIVSVTTSVSILSVQIAVWMRIAAKVDSAHPTLEAV